MSFLPVVVVVESAKMVFQEATADSVEEGLEPSMFKLRVMPSLIQAVEVVPRVTMTSAQALPVSQMEPQTLLVVTVDLASWSSDMSCSRQMHRQ